MYYLLAGRSLTGTQRMEKALARAGIGSMTVRSPTAAQVSGCGYCVRVTEKNYKGAINALELSNLSPKHVFFCSGSGNCTEVPF